MNELVCTALEEYEEILDIDNESPKQLSDDDVKDFLLQSEGISNPLMIQSLERVRRNEVLIAAKRIGAGLRQLSRAAGEVAEACQKSSMTRAGMVSIESRVVMKVVSVIIVVSLPYFRQRMVP